MPLTQPTRIVFRRTWQPMDPDAAAYIAAVEAADGQTLEEPVKIAIDNFVLGCKADGIWNAIKASCILAGARTLSGALVPLVGAAPTNFNFVAGDYDRKTGLVGDGNTKSLNSNRNNTSDPQDNTHLSIYISTATTSSAGFFPRYIGVNNTSSPFDGNEIGRLQNNGSVFIRSNNNPTSDIPSSTGFVGISRASSTSFVARSSQSTVTRTINSTARVSSNHTIFKAADSSDYINGRLAFYSIGEALDLALLDARVTALINAFASAIP